MRALQMSVFIGRSFPLAPEHFRNNYYLMLILSRDKSTFIARGNVYTCRPNNDNFQTNGAPYMCSAIATSAIEATPTKDAWVVSTNLL